MVTPTKCIERLKPHRAVNPSPALLLDRSNLTKGHPLITKTFRNDILRLTNKHPLLLQGASFGALMGTG